MPVNHPIYDVVVIGGGINGVGIAVDAVGRGLSVFLCEKDDLASHTSSASSKLIHGGLRYLEHKEFRLVREALAEREVLLAKAPHIIRPLRFIMPHQPHLRPAWLIRTGLFLYDHLGKRKKLAASKSIRFAASSSPLKAEITQGFEYSDCVVDDARLVILNAMQAREKGAELTEEVEEAHGEEYDVNSSAPRQRKMKTSISCPHLECHHNNLNHLDLLESLKVIQI